MVKPNGLLVTVSSTYYYAYTRARPGGFAFSPHQGGDVPEPRPWAFQRDDRPRGAPHSPPLRVRLAPWLAESAQLGGKQCEKFRGKDRDPLQDSALFGI